MDAAFFKQAVASAVIGVVIEKLASILDVGPFKGRNLSHGSRQKLKIALLSAEAELIEAKANQITNPAVKKWLGLLSDAVYEAEELLDKIDRTEAESQTRKRKFSDFFSGFVNLFGKGLESELQEVLERLEYMTEHKDLPGLKEVAGEVPLQQLTSCSVESHVYGRDYDKERIFELWESDHASSNGICVLPIVGMGGVGKTTLAQMVYNDSRVNENFDLKAWVYVSEYDDSFNILKTILGQISWFTCDTQNLSSLQTKIRKTLKGKKFLLVLDNVFDDVLDWVELLKVFKRGAQEIKILVTTRSEVAASKVSTVPTHHYLKELSDDDCWAIFAKHAFVNGKPHEFQHLEAMSKAIVQKCKGLPLAAKTIGCLLGSDKNITHWIKILKNHIWDSPEPNIVPSLRLSYYFLPPYLKRCFIFCSMFPRDFEFNKRRLIVLWMAEGLVDGIENVSLEIIAEGYFNDLLSRSLFERSINSESKFLMPDLVFDLAISMSDEFLLPVHRMENDESNEKDSHEQ